MEPSYKNGVDKMAPTVKDLAIRHNEEVRLIQRAALDRIDAASKKATSLAKLQAEIAGAMATLDRLQIRIETRYRDDLARIEAAARKGK